MNGRDPRWRSSVLGRIGRLHAELLARRIPGASLATVCRRRPQQDLGPRCLVRRPGGRVEVDEVLAGDVNTVAIYTSRRPPARPRPLIVAWPAAPAPSQDYGVP